MKKLMLDGKALGDMRFWLASDRRTLDKVFRLMEEVSRTPFDGTGKPEPLRGDKRGRWSRRITDEHRMVYEVTDKFIIVHSLRGHYEN